MMCTEHLVSTPDLCINQIVLFLGLVLNSALVLLLHSPDPMFLIQCSWSNVSDPMVLIQLSWTYVPYQMFLLLSAFSLLLGHSVLRKDFGQNWEKVAGRRVVVTGRKEKSLAKTKTCQIRLKNGKSLKFAKIYENYWFWMAKRFIRKNLHHQTVPFLGFWNCGFSS